MMSSILKSPQMRGKACAAVGLLASLVILPMLNDDRFVISVATTVIITAIAASALHLIIRTGHVSLAQGAFIGLGAYASVLVSMKMELPFIVGLMASFVGPAAVALLVGPLTLRLTGKYFALVTFLFGEIIRIVFVEWTSVTGGSNGIFQIPPPAEFLAGHVPFYYFALGVAVLLIAVIGRILGSEIGATIDSIRLGQRLVECAGVPVILYKVVIYGLACGMTGVAGCLQAYFIRYIDPTSFSTIQSVNLVVMNIIGGMNSLIGPIIGTVFLIVIPEFLRSYVELQRVIFGIILVIIMAAFPGGMVALGELLIARLRWVYRKGRQIG